MFQEWTGNIPSILYLILFPKVALVRGCIITLVAIFQLLSVIKLWLVKGASQGVSGEGRQYSIHFIFVTFPKVTLVRGCRLQISLSEVAGLRVSSKL